jgi:hypothetical protein
MVVLADAQLLRDGQGREVVKFTTPSLKEQVTGCDSAQTEVAGNEKHDDD